MLGDDTKAEIQFKNCIYIFPFRKKLLIQHPQLMVVFFFFVQLSIFTSKLFA